MQPFPIPAHAEEDGFALLATKPKPPQLELYTLFFTIVRKTRFNKLQNVTSNLMLIPGTDSPGLLR